MYKMFEEEEKEEFTIEPQITVVSPPPAYTATLAIYIILALLAIIHASYKLSKSNTSLRIGFLFVSIIFGPLYWIIYPIVYLSGGIPRS